MGSQRYRFQRHYARIRGHQYEGGAHKQRDQGQTDLGTYPGGQIRPHFAEAHFIMDAYIDVSLRLRH